MKRIYFLALITGIVSLCACKNQSKPTDVNPRQLKADTITAIALDNRFQEADSLVLVFYKDPYGPDSLRYTRYYSQKSIVGDGINQFLLQVSQSYKQEELRKCRSEGKIWCFAKGKIFQTVYFSTRCADCCFTYLIKDGNFYYSSISNQFKEWLATENKQAIELPNSAAENP